MSIVKNRGPAGSQISTQDIEVQEETDFYNLRRSINHFQKDMPNLPPLWRYFQNQKG